METFLAKIYAKNSETLVLEVCNDMQVNNIVKLSTYDSPYVRIQGASYVAISEEAKEMFIDVLHKADKSYEKSTSIGIVQYYNLGILLTWNGNNKQEININNLQNIKIGMGLGYSDENYLNYLQLKDNEFLKNYKFERNHTQKVLSYLKNVYSKKHTNQTETDIQQY